MTNPNSGTGVTTRCQFQFSDGRCCRMLRRTLHSSFCAFHARRELQLLESQRLGGEISTSLNGDFLTATDINHVLGKIFTAAAQDRISLRKAVALTYMGQVMLSSLPHVKQRFPFRYKIRPLAQGAEQCRSPLQSFRPHQFQFLCRMPPGAP
jgi:hypothetical protein